MFWISLLVLSFNLTAATPLFDYRIQQKTSHNSNSFTQGLQVYQGHLLESSGLYGKSFLQQWDLKAHKAVLHHPLPSHIFAEGIAEYNDTLFLLTWKAGILMRFRLPQLTPISHQNYDGEGWGLTRMGEMLVMSNGSAELSFHQPEDFSVIRRLTVTENGKAVQLLNDLTFDGRYLWANIWKSRRVIAIDPNNGHVVGQLLLGELIDQQPNLRRSDVLNGLAWDVDRKGLWVTGKRWHDLYLLELIPPQELDKMP